MLGTDGEDEILGRLERQRATACAQAPEPGRHRLQHRIADLAASDEAYTKANLLMLRNPSIINFLDGCAVSLPCHRAGEAPVGLSLAGTAGQDQRLLSVALAVENLLARA